MANFARDKAWLHFLAQLNQSYGVRYMNGVVISEGWSFDGVGGLTLTYALVVFEDVVGTSVLHMYM